MKKSYFKNLNFSKYSVLWFQKRVMKYILLFTRNRNLRKKICRNRENKEETGGQPTYMESLPYPGRGGRRRIRCTESNFTVIFFNNNENYKINLLIFQIFFPFFLKTIFVHLLLYYQLKFKELC